MKKALLFGIIIGLLFSGCAATKPILPDYIKKIAIPTFKNQTLQYGIETDFTDYIIKQFRIDGRLQVAGKDQSDAVIEGTIRKYLLEPLTYDVNNVIVSNRIKIVIDVKFTDLRENKVSWEQKEIGGLSGGTTNFNVSGINIENEFTARQRIYKELAEDIVNRVIYGWENY